MSPNMTALALNNLNYVLTNSGTVYAVTQKQYLSYSKFNTLLKIERKRTKALLSQLDEFFIQKHTEFVHNQLVGSSRFKWYCPEAFWGLFGEMTEEDAEKLLNASDYDIALKLDSFVLETLSRNFPSFKKKESDGEEEYGREGLLKVVYTLPVRDLIFFNPESFKHWLDMDSDQNWSDTHNVDASVLFTDDFLDRQIELLFVTDLGRTLELWNTIKADTFVNYYWKRSPKFIGKEALKATFSTFEQLVQYGKKRYSPKAAKIAAGDLIPMPGGGGGQILIQGQAADVVWADEAPMPQVQVNQF